jgi:hypothetical protein
MRKNLFVKPHSFYVTLFVFAATAAQAAPRVLDPEARTWWRFAKQTLGALRRAVDVITLPIG